MKNLSSTLSLLALAGGVWLLPPPEAPAQPGGKGPPGGPMGGPMGGIRKLVAQFDKDKNGRLDYAERKAAREFLKEERKKGGPRGPGGGMMFVMPRPGEVLPAMLQDQLGLDAKQKEQMATLQKDVDERVAKILNADQRKTLKDRQEMRFGPGGPGGPGGFGRPREPKKPGPAVKPDEVKAFPKADLYAADVLRTVFLTFEHKDWEEELADFYHTDVEVPATLVVDGKTYRDVGVRFRGNSSFGGKGPGDKRSLNVTIDFVHEGQRVYGYKTLNLLNGNDDPSFLHTVLYSLLCREHIPTPKANLMKVAINGESWGVYTNVQQFNKEFTKDFFKSSKGARWRVPVNFSGGGGLDHLGDKLEDYKRAYSVKSKDDEKAWKALMNLCKVLKETPPEKLEKALEPILDVEGALWFLALDCALINNDGYWTRASDYSIYLDEKGKFHVVPHDMNETFSPAGGGPGGPPGPGGPGGGMARPSGVALDPLVGLNDDRKPLRSRLLAVPALKERYLKMVRTIAEEQLDWKKLGPVVAGYRKLVEKEVEADTRKLYTTEEFRFATGDEAGSRGREMSLRGFADGRRAFLLGHEEIKKLGG